MGDINIQNVEEGEKLLGAVGKSKKKKKKKTKGRFFWGKITPKFGVGEIGGIKTGREKKRQSDY